MMMSLTNPEFAGLLNVEANHDEQTKYIYDSNRKATFALSNYVELLDLSIERFQRQQATAHSQGQSGRPSIVAKHGIVQIKFLTANNTKVSSRLMYLYFSSNFLYGYPLFLIKPQSATKLEITLTNVNAIIKLHSRLLVKSEDE